MNKNTVELGDEVVCKVTGFSGVVTGITKHLMGCDRAIVQQPLNKEGKYGECFSIDMPSLSVKKKNKVKVEVQPDAKRGGPSTRVLPR